MIHILEARPLEGHCLWVRFSDGLEGCYAVAPERRGGVFMRLLDPAVFDAVTINGDFGCVEWPGGIDLCPTSMHDDIAAAKSAATVAAAE